MESLNINNWKWNIDEQAVLYPWFVDFKKHIQQGLIKSNSERDVFLRFVKIMPMEEEVINDPRYTALLEKMKLT